MSIQGRRRIADQYDGLTDPRERALSLVYTLGSDGSVAIYHPDFVGDEGDEWIKAIGPRGSVNPHMRR